MIKRFGYGVIFLVLAGCAGTGVSLFPGEKNAQGVFNPTGAVAVLDPQTGQDVQVLDQANSRSGVNRRRVLVKNVSAEMLEKRYGALLASLPEAPRKFVLYFKPNSAELIDPEAMKDVFAEVKRRPGVDVQIVGHTDSTGSTPDNDALSIKRAQGVKILLASLDLDAEIIRATGRGEREPKVDLGDDIASDENRRVEIYVK